MPGKPRPAATPAQTLTALDHLIATSHIGQHETAQRLGVNITDLTCFAFVLEAGDDLLTAGDLAARAHVTTGAITGVLNRLERAGYVTRRPDPNDRRRIRVAAVPSAVTKVQTLYTPYYTRINELLADYSPAEIAVLHDLFTRTGTLVTEYLEELRKKD